MNKLNKIRTIKGKVMIALVIVLALFSTVAKADINKGKRVYLKKLKAPCNMNGVKFAKLYNQDDWEEFKDNGTLGKEVKRICPKSKLKAKYEADLYSFVYEFAKDSGKIPSCN